MTIKSQLALPGLTQKNGKSTNTCNNEDSNVSTLSKLSRGTTIFFSEGKKGKYLTNHSLHPTRGDLCELLVKMLVTGHCWSQKGKMAVRYVVSSVGGLEEEMSGPQQKLLFVSSVESAFVWMDVTNIPRSMGYLCQTQEPLP